MPTRAETPGPVRLLALGDSYTIGEGVAPDEGWPAQLGRRLVETGVPVAEVAIVARTGWTTSELDAGIDDARPAGPFDLVTLLIGVNDQFRGLDLEGYRVELAGLVVRAAALSASSVVIVSIPDWGVTPFGAAYDRDRVAAEIDSFNEVARREAERVGAAWVDITHLSRTDDPGQVAGDGLHPSAAQYRLWVDEILPVVLALLGAR